MYYLQSKTNIFDAKCYWLTYADAEAYRLTLSNPDNWLIQFHADPVII